MNSEEGIFEHAAALPETDRAAYLDAACAGQPELSGRIESLLRSHDVNSALSAKVMVTGMLSVLPAAPVLRADTYDVNLI